MQRLKKVLAWVICAVMVMAVVPAVNVSAEVYSGTCGENLTWELDTETGVLTISGSGDMTDWESYSDVAWYYQTSSIKSIVIENGVTSIGSYAFSCCKSLINMTIPNSITSIGDFAFCDCTSLTNVIIPDSVMKVGESAFIGCEALKNVTIGNSVTSIADSTFSHCRVLFSMSSNAVACGHIKCCYNNSGGRENESE